MTSPPGPLISDVDWHISSQFAQPRSMQEFSGGHAPSLANMHLL